MAETFDKARPGRMTKFRITEISGVDKPAQEGALAVIMKRRDPEPEVDPAILIRKAAITAGIEALAKARAAKTGETFAKAYSSIITAEPALYEALL